MNSRAIQFFMLYAAVGAVRAAGPDVSLDAYDPFIRAFLHQDVTVVNGRRYTAAQFGSETLNGLAALGLARSDMSELVRNAIVRDSVSHPTEYAARSLMAEARVAARTERGPEQYQQELWRAFLDDPRYFRRILAEIRGTPQGVSAGEATLHEVDRLRAALVVGLAERAAETGCNARPLTVFGTIQHADSMLAAAIFDVLVSTPSVTTADLVEALQKQGWVLRE